MTPPCYLCARIHRLALQNSINSDNDDVATPTKRAVCAGCTPSGFAAFPGARRAAAAAYLPPHSLSWEPLPLLNFALPFRNEGGNYGGVAAAQLRLCSGARARALVSPRFAVCLRCDILFRAPGPNETRTARYERVVLFLLIFFCILFFIFYVAVCDALRTYGKYFAKQLSQIGHLRKKVSENGDVCCCCSPGCVFTFHLPRLRKAACVKLIKAQTLLKVSPVLYYGSEGTGSGCTMPSVKQTKRHVHQAFLC